MKGYFSNKDAKIQNWTTHPGLIKIFRIGKYEKIKCDKIWEYHNGGPPQMRMPKFTLFTCVSKLDISQFQDTQANMKER